MADGLTFILPIFNQAANLTKVLDAWAPLLASLNRDYEIILVDDGSTDETPALLNGTEGRPGLTSKTRHMQAIRHPERRGYGACLRSALEKAKQPLIFYTSCRQPYNPSDLRKLLPRIEEADPDTGEKISIVNGYRANLPLSGKRKFAGKLWRGFQGLAMGKWDPPPTSALPPGEERYAWWMWLLFGIRISDIESHFKLIRRNMLDRFPIQSDGDLVHVEILAKANFLTCIMDEVPILEKRGPFATNPEPPGPIPRTRELWRLLTNPRFVTRDPAKASVAPAT